MMNNKSPNNSMITLMYHDVVEREVHQESGFPSADAAYYKLDPDQFKAHIAAIRRSVGDRPMLATELLNGSGHDDHSWMITFDDGGSSFYGCIADELEAIDWRGHFFIATDYIGKPGFMTGDQIRALHDRGHVIGSHSSSHPLRFASCPPDDMKCEWEKSVQVLTELLDDEVRVASVPGGQYSRSVAQTAARAGIKVLFNSEPRIGAIDVDGCLVFGRYAIQRWTGPETAAGMAAGRLFPRFRQRLWWEAKKITKTFGGVYYLRLRESLMEKAQSNN